MKSSKFRDAKIRRSSSKACGNNTKSSSLGASCQSQRSKGPSSIYYVSHNSFRMELDLHGCYPRQVHNKIYKLINQAILRKYSEVVVITGKGRGVLLSEAMSALKELKTQRCITYYREAASYEGGSGAIVVSL